MQQIIEDTLSTAGSLTIMFLLICLAIAGLNNNRRD